MKLVVGLGNPGKEYEHTRHNVGFMVIDALAQELRVIGYKLQAKFEAEVAQAGEVILVKPQTFMNRSGVAVQKLMQFYKILPENVYVIHDDLDIRLGEYKISDRGPKVHNGINSIRESVGASYWYVRIGVDNREQEPTPMSGKDYVLQGFSNEEKSTLEAVVALVTRELIKKAEES